MAAMIIWIRRAGISPRIDARKRIDPSARTETALIVIQTCVVRIGTARTEMCTTGSVASEAANVLRQCGKSMLTPALADLFETLGVIRATTHAIHILRNGRMIIAGEG